MQFGQPLQYLTGNVDGVGAGLLLHDNHSAAFVVGERFLRALLYRVDNSRHIAQVNIGAIARSDYHIFHLAGILELALDTQRIRFVSDIEVSSRYVSVFCSDGCADRFNGQMTGL